VRADASADAADEVEEHHVEICEGFELNPEADASLGDPGRSANVAKKLEIFSDVLGEFELKLDIAAERLVVEQAEWFDGDAPAGHVDDAAFSPVRRWTEAVLRMPLAGVARCQPSFHLVPPIPVWLPA
jgi:hypothetical protein